MDCSAPAPQCTSWSTDNIARWFACVKPPISDTDNDGYVGACDCNDNNAAIHSGAIEICDGNDNDCDTLTDEGCACVDDTTQEISCGIGECSATAMQICEGGQWTGTCSPRDPSAETCDNLDNDCDTQTDEELGSTTCGIGACEVTVQNCAGGIVQTCTEGQPQTEVCSYDIGIDQDQDCDGFADIEDPDCRCEITNAFWSEEIVSDGTLVRLIANSRGLCEGQTVEFDIWEDDTPSILDWFGDLLDDDVVQDYVGASRLSATFSGNIAIAEWTALYKTTDPRGVWTETGQPEYYFKAKSTYTEVSSDNILTVTGNLPPTAPSEFLIKPNGGEIYDQSAIVEWNPASDPDDGALVYRIEYSDDSGNAWNTLEERYGHDDAVEYNGEEKEIVEFDFG